MEAMIKEFHKAKDMSSIVQHLLVKEDVIFYCSSDDKRYFWHGDNIYRIEGQKVFFHARREDYLCKN